MADPGLREHAERGGEGRSLRLVDVGRMRPVLGPPGDERLLALYLLEEPSPPLIPRLGLARRLDGVDGRALRGVQRFKPVVLVSVPAPRRSLDADRRQHPQVRVQPLEPGVRHRADIGRGGVVDTTALIAVHTSRYRGGSSERYSVAGRTPSGRI